MRRKGFPERGSLMDPMNWKLLLHELVCCVCSALKPLACKVQKPNSSGIPVCWLTQFVHQIYSIWNMNTQTPLKSCTITDINVDTYFSKHLHDMKYAKKKRRGENGHIVPTSYGDENHFSFQEISTVNCFCRREARGKKRTINWRMNTVLWSLQNTPSASPSKLSYWAPN